MSLASCTIDSGAWSDPKVAYLAVLAQYVDGIETAVGKLARLWARCTFLGSDVVSEVEVNSCMGSVRGVELLLASGLGERAETGIRVKGRYANDDGKDRLGWFSELSAKRSRAGSARAASATRGVLGRFVAQDTTSRESVRPTANDQHATSTSVEATSTSPAADEHDGELSSTSTSAHQDQRSEIREESVSLGSGSSFSGDPVLSRPEPPDPPAIVGADLEAPPPPDEPPGDLELELPDGFEPDPEPDLDEVAKGLGVDLADELVKFHRRATERGTTSADWQGMWRGWIRRAIEWARKQRAKAAAKPVNGERAYDPIAAAAIRAANVAAAEREREHNAEKRRLAEADRAEVARIAAEALKTSFHIQPPTKKADE